MANNNKKNTVTKTKGFVTELTTEDPQDLPALEIEGSVNIVNGVYLVDGVPLSGSGGGPVTLSGDVSGPALTNTVQQIQGNIIDLSGIVDGNLLGLQGGQIVPVSSSIDVSRVVCVDTVFGNDSTGRLEDLSKPFATVQAAVDAVAASTNPEPYVVLLPIEVIESITVPALTAAQFIIFSARSANTDWYGEVGTPAVTTNPGSASVIFNNILLSGRSSPAIYAQGNGSEFVGFRNGGLERDGSKSDLAGEFYSVTVFYDNAGIASGSFTHVDCPTVVFISVNLPDALGDFRVSGLNSPSFFVAANGVLSNLILEGDTGCFILSQVNVLGTLTTENLNPNASIVFSGIANDAIFQPEGILDFSNSKIANIIIGSAGSQWNAIAKRLTSNIINIGDNVILDAESSWLEQSNISFGNNAQITGWNRFKFGGLANSWFDPIAPIPGQGEASNMASPHFTLAEAIDFVDTGGIVNIFPGQFSESPVITRTNFSIHGASRDRTTWFPNGSDACVLPDASTISIQNISIDGQGGNAISSTGTTLSLDRVNLNGAFSLNVSNSTITARNSFFGTDVTSVDSILLFENTQLSANITATGTVMVVYLAFNNCIGAPNLFLYGTPYLTVDKVTTFSDIDASQINADAGTPYLVFYGSANNVTIAGIQGMTVDFKNSTVFGNLIFDSYTGAFSATNFQNATLTNIEARSSGVGQIIIDLSYSNIRGQITIGDDIILNLTGAVYDPNNITIPGSGKYYDTTNPRTRTVPSGNVGTLYAVQPRDSIVICDNSSVAVQLDLNEAALSTGQVSVVCLADPSVNNVTINAYPGELIDGNASIVLNQSSQLRIVLGCSPSELGWGTLLVWPGSSAPPAPLSFTSQSGTTYTLTANVESGVIMTNPGIREVTIPDSVADGTEFTIVDGAGTAFNFNIEVIPTSSTIIGVSGNDFISSNYASVTYRYSATLGAWSRI